VEDRPDTLVGLCVEVEAEVACDREDPWLPDIPLLVEPEDLVEEGVVGPGRDELVCVVEADDERSVAVPEPGGDPPLDPVKVARRRCVAEGLLEDAPEDCKRCAVVAAVDVDRDDLLRGLGNLGKDPADGGGLPGSRLTAEDGAPRAPAPEGWPEKEGEFPDLGVAVVDLLRNERELKDLRVPEERLVVSGGGKSASYVTLEKRGLLNARCVRDESERGVRPPYAGCPRLSGYCYRVQCLIL
jgi:hypothetical protein